MRRPIEVLLALSASMVAAFATGVVPAEAEVASPPEAIPLALPEAFGEAPAPGAEIAQVVVEADPFTQLDEAGLDGEGLRAAAGPLPGRLAAFDLRAIDLTAIDDDDRRCLTEAIYYEARSQTLAGRMAVADVVLNRVESRRYPNTVCGVVFQGAAKGWGCQFSFACDGSMEKAVERRAMIKAQAAATAVLGGFRLPLSGGATHYHADYVQPFWVGAMEQTAVLDDHLFYRVAKRQVRLASN
ncbi:cell wall hydrolase [Parvularcula dongshanensis]|uniref:Cell wall hydrolase SleB domain-containing protein n=1 Tax=Parvularcula dongshanensis TaxID=1173995 RepID=A0A840I4K7_9PROT|nr:cell wall hydrolase [Parvularcula dongshanensis]MBB4659717.1 hypothetical protein [Parvularcula dongshanensis]